MNQNNPFQTPTLSQDTQDPLTEILQDGARQLLAKALEAEVQAHLDALRDQVDEHGNRLVIRNGYLPERKIQTGIGAVEIRQPRVRDKRPGEEECFVSKIVPPYLRRTKSMEEFIPWLYLRGVSTGDFSEAMEPLLGADAPGLSAATVVRLKKVWEKDYLAWNQRDLSHKRYVYIWVDGIHFNIRLEDQRSCILVVIGATADGKKELIAVEDGVRESEQSWREVLLGLKARGLTTAPELAIGDGALGFWKAIAKEYPSTKWQRCWVHKTANVRNKFPKSQQPKAKAKLHEIWNSSSRKDANKAFDLFVSSYEAKYPKATQCLLKDRESMLAFYDFPAQHWAHLRTTNPIESTFATVRLRTARTKGSGSRLACLTMVFQLALSAEKRWRKLNGHQLLADVINGVQFKDGIKVFAA